MVEYTAIEFANHSCHMTHIGREMLELEVYVYSEMVGYVPMENLVDVFIMLQMEPIP